jgi:hypothetical protein
MVELIPMALIAVFGYAVYCWSAATNKPVRQDRHAPNQRGPREKLQTSDSENEPHPQPTGA